MNIEGFAGIGVFDNDFGRFILNRFGFVIGLSDGFSVLRNELGVTLPVLFERAVVALEAALGVDVARQ